MKRNKEEIGKLVMEISKRLEAIKNAEKDYPQQIMLRGIACALIEKISDAEGKSIEEVIDGIKRIFIRSRERVNMRVKQEELISLIMQDVDTELNTLGFTNTTREYNVNSNHGAGKVQVEFTRSICADDEEDKTPFNIEIYFILRTGECFDGLTVALSPGDFRDNCKKDLRYLVGMYEIESR